MAIKTVVGSNQTVLKQSHEYEDFTARQTNGE